jgi:hypothetical protein
MAAEVDPGVTAENPTRDLINAFIAHEATLLTLPAKRRSSSVLRDLSISMGTVCAYIIDGAYESQVGAQVQYTEESISALRQPGAIASRDIRSHFQLDLVEAELDIIKARQNPDDAAEARGWFNDVTYYWLDRFCTTALEDQARHETQNSIGFVTELALLALINRQGSADSIILPSLPHHESRLGGSHKNYDQVLATREDVGVSTTRIQVKRACVGLADHEITYGNGASRGYIKEIRFASGCCDLKIDWNPETYEMDLTTPEALLNQRNAGVATHINRYLGSLAQNFLDTIEAPERAGDHTFVEAA